MTLYTFPSVRGAGAQGLNAAVVYYDAALTAPATLTTPAGLPIPASTIVAGPDGLWPLFQAPATVLYLQAADGSVVTVSPVVSSTELTLTDALVTTTAPSAGGGGALPATPAGYLTVSINGATQQIPYY